MDSNQGIPNEIQAIFLGCIFVWIAPLGYILLSMGIDGAPSAYQAWMCCAWSLACLLAPLGLVAGAGAGLPVS